jgi:hypothetical protein
VKVATCRPADRGRPRTVSADGVLTIEAILMLPVVVVVAAGLLGIGAILADTLLVHEAARAGARAAATSTGAGAPTRAAELAAPELQDLVVRVDPIRRRSGDLVHVRAEVVRTIGPFSHVVRARAVARVELGVGGVP